MAIADRQQYRAAIPRKEFVIFVEGLDEVYVVEKICEEEGIADRIQVAYYAESLEKLNGFLNVFVRDANFPIVQRVGLTKDSDTGAENALRSLETSWRLACQTLDTLGLRRPECEFFAIPNNAERGRLEDICLRSPTLPRVLACAEQMYDCSRAVVDYDIDREKSLVAAYLSMMRSTGLRLGTGALAGCWNLGSLAFQPFREFIRSLVR